MKCARDRLILALDVPGLKEAEDLVERLSGRVKYFKIGMELHNAAGPEAARMVRRHGGEVFLDLKFHDIPNTVGRTAEVIAGLGVFMFNVHAAGGSEMMRRAAESARVAAARQGYPKPLVIGMTLLTSIDQKILNQEMQVSGSLGDHVVFWSRLAQEAGLDGVVASPREISLIKEACGSGFVTVTPGIRPVWAEMGDQRRTMTPKEAVALGGDYLVIGRPITQAPDPVEAAGRVLDEIEEGLASTIVFTSSLD